MYLGYICQHKNVIFLITLWLLCSCAIDDPIEIPPVGAKAVWADSPKRFDFRTKGDEAIAHPFFDLVPFSSTTDNSVNFFPLSSPSSNAFYKLDMVSGKRVKVRAYCKRKDLWKKYNKTLHKQTFTWGIVPRIMDQLGQIQNIVVFGNTKFYSEFDYRYVRSNRVRVIGGMLEQFCSSFPCERGSAWKSRLLLIAVDDNDPKFSDVTDFVSLRAKIDWDYFHSFVENINGGTRRLKVVVPNYRVVGNIPGDVALRTAVKKGHLFRFKEMQTLKTSCQKLYDHIWSFAKNDNEELGKNFIEFYLKHGKQYQTCTKFVRTANLNTNLDRFWFFAHLNSYFIMEDLGQIYSCRRNVWELNPKNLSGAYVKSYARNIKDCSIDDLNAAMSSAPTMLKAISSSTHNFYSRYIEYDSGQYASHERIYNWIKFDGKRYSCNNSDDYKLDEVESWFPIDVKWKNYKAGNKSSRNLKVRNGK